ncbi:hypothetical protein HYH03_017186 [Edaphochlamys debaryana]|uniref:Uncharacterized protein n=1 Tax=Edaphochlamys debaryana TaxID=47281 RepID=A0A835XII3_9CHLO|nr:hypothetical protein HYH03_017186 [Edaphochlamys debaryana]|eukprot:KAG2484020.1 hypothetical protein HYH03_017186 [Edaphochlamys debaryana]
MAQATTHDGRGLALLTEKDILPQILKHLSPSEARSTRLICTDTRRAYDRQVKVLHAKCGAVSELLSVLGFLVRGCRPQVVCLDDAATSRAGLRLLRPFVETSGQSPLKCQALHLPAVALNESLAHAVASAFPALQQLKLTQAEKAELPTLEALKLLLSGTDSAGASSSERGDGDADAPPPGLLPSLTSLHLSTSPPAPSPQPCTSPPPHPLPAAWAQLLRSSAHRLRCLRLAFGLTSDDHVRPLAALSRLRSLHVGACEGSLLSPLLAPFTGLTSLGLGSTEGPLPTAALAAGLPLLAELLAPSATLDARTVHLLAALTRLEVQALEAQEAPSTAGSLGSPTGSGTLSEGGAGAGAGGGVGWAGGMGSGSASAGGAGSSSTEPRPSHSPGPSPGPGQSSGCWQLPPRLAAITLRYQAAETLPALRASPLRPLDWDLTLTLRRGRSVADDGRLLPAGEAALCEAAGFLEGRLGPASHVYVTTGRHILVLPVAGEAGPGRRNHGAWLRALGRAGVPRLTLYRFKLSHVDLATIASSLTSLQVLEICDLADYPATPLPLLATLPRLERLSLDADCWAGPERTDLVRAPFGAPGALVALALDARFRGVVELAYSRDLPGESLARLEGVVGALRGELAAIGADRERLQLVAYEA